MAGQRVPHLRAPEWFARAATVAAAGHLFVAATFAVRRLFHNADIASAPVTRVEEWIYVPVWALFGAAAFWVGMRTSDVLRRWIGLSILIGTTLYAVPLAFSRLSGIAQFSSLLGLGTVLAAVAWFARGSREPAPTVKPGARRDRRHGRRQRSP